MIQTKEDLREYLKCDKIHLGIKYSKPKWNDEIWKFEKHFGFMNTIITTSMD